MPPKSITRIERKQDEVVSTESGVSEETKAADDFETASTAAGDVQPQNEGNRVINLHHTYTKYTKYKLDLRECGVYLRKAKNI